jgi:succinoglycan biosynthesis protein ExoM
MTRNPIVCVCICTCNRPQQLSSLLAHLAELSPIESYEVELLIIDNASNGSSKRIYDEWQSRLPISLHFAVETKRGIPFARNRAVDTALDAVGADYVAFIDDDDTPHPDWLRHLLSAAHATCVDLVFGNWTWSNEIQIPPLLHSVGFLQPQRLGSGLFGLPLRAATCNVLIRRALLDSLRRKGPVFSEQFAFTGGSDTEFFVRAVKLGATFQRCEHSVVFRRWERDRLTLQGAMKRAFRYGITQGRIARLHLSPGERRRRYRRKWKQLRKSLTRCIAKAFMRKGSESVYYLSEGVNRAGYIFGVHGGAIRYYTSIDPMGPNR